MNEGLAGLEKYRTHKFLYAPSTLWSQSLITQNLLCMLRYTHETVLSCILSFILVVVVDLSCGHVLKLAELGLINFCVCGIFLVPREGLQIVTEPK